MFILLFLLWVVFNGRLAIDVILVGAAVCAALDWFAMRYCKWYVTKDWRWKEYLPAFARYLVLLLREILVANWTVIKIILSPRMKENIHPQMVRFPCDYKSDIMKALLANSITLTPGTITVRIRSDHFVVHALTPEMGADMPQSSFYRACDLLDTYTCKPGDVSAKLEGQKPASEEPPVPEASPVPEEPHAPAGEPISAPPEQSAPEQNTEEER